MTKLTINKDNFVNFFTNKEPLVRPNNINFEKEHTVSIESNNLIFNGYQAYCDESLERNCNIDIKHSDGNYLVTIPKLKESIRIFPEYSDDDQLVLLKKWGLTLNKSSTCPYILFGNPSKPAVIIIANTHDNDFLSSYTLDGLINGIVESNLKGYDYSFLIFPSSIFNGTNKLDSIIKRYKLKGTIFLELNGVNDTKSSIELFNSKASKTNINLESFNIDVLSDKLNKERSEYKEFLFVNKLTYLRFNLSYWKLEPNDGVNMGYNIASQILK